MTDEAWNAERERLQQQLQEAATALLEHMGAGAVAAPLPHGGVVAAGPRASVVRLLGE